MSRGTTALPEPDVQALETRCVGRTRTGLLADAFFRSCSRATFSVFLPARAFSHGLRSLSGVKRVLFPVTAQEIVEGQTS